MSARSVLRIVGDVAVVDCYGSFKLGEGTNMFREALNDLLKRRWRYILINFTDARYIDSSTVTELLNARTKASDSGAVLKLLNLPKRLQDPGLALKLCSEIETLDDEAKALASF